MLVVGDCGGRGVEFGGDKSSSSSSSSSFALVVAVVDVVESGTTQELEGAPVAQLKNIKLKIRNHQ